MFNSCQIKNSQEKYYTMYTLRHTHTKCYTKYSVNGRSSKAHCIVGYIFHNVCSTVIWIFKIFNACRKFTDCGNVIIRNKSKGPILMI